jgi:toxin ParE1/3/4
MKIRWTPAAAADIECISKYLISNFPSYHRQTLKKIYDSIRNLAKFPNLGRAAHNLNTKELWLIPLPYGVTYRVKDETIEVLRIWHASQHRGHHSAN